MRSLLAAVLLTAPAGPAPGQPAVADTRTHPDDLLMGPCKGTVLVRHLESDPYRKLSVTVLQVTRKQVVYVERPGAEPVVKAGGYVSQVVTEEPKRVWDWDIKKKEFAGDDPVRPDPIDVSPRPLPAGAVPLYLLVRADQLYTDLNDALRVGAAARVRGNLDRAAALEAFARKVGAPNEVAALFDLAVYAPRQDDRWKRVRAAQQEWNAVKLGRRALMARNAREYQAREQLRRVDAAFGLIATAAREGDVAGALSDSALAQYRLRADYEGKQDAIRQAADRLEKEAADKKAAALDELVREELKLEARLPAAAAALKLAKPQLFDPVVLSEPARKGDRRAVAAVHEARRDAIRLLGYEHPLVTAELNRLQGVALDQPGADGERRSDDLFRLARETAAAVRLVPAGGLFDADRVEVLAKAADLVQRAVARAHGPVNWSRCYDPRADYGVRLLNKAAEFGPAADPAALARASRAWLLFLRGLHDLALEQGQDVEKLRAGDPVARYNLARLYGKAQRGKEAAEHFYAALKFGYPTAQPARRDDDLFPVRLQGETWQFLTKPNLTATVDSYQGEGGKWSYSIVLENKSPFPIGEVTLTYTVPVKDTNGKVKPETFRRKVDRIDPDSTLVWVDVVTAPGIGGTGTVTVTSPEFPGGLSVKVKAGYVID